MRSGEAFMSVILVNCLGVMNLELPLDNIDPMSLSFVFVLAFVSF